MTTDTIPNVIYYPNLAASWLVNQPRNDTARRLVARLGALVTIPGSPVPVPDVDAIAEMVLEYDLFQQAWGEYADRHPAPRGDDDAAYDRWEAAGPKCPDGARVIGPMSSGEKRMVRMLAVLSSVRRVPFSISDIDGIDAEFRADWRRVVAGTDWGK